MPSTSTLPLSDKPSPTPPVSPPPQKREYIVLEPITFELFEIDGEEVLIEVIDLVNN